MRKLALVLVFLGLGCEIHNYEGGRERALGIEVSVTDDPAPLTGAGDDPLFELAYSCPEDGPSFLVSDLQIHLSSQGVERFGAQLQVFLAEDRNRDGRFGPGDSLSVAERNGGFSEYDLGTVKVQLLEGWEYDAPILAEADWAAR